MDLSHRLWQDRSIYRSRADRQAAAYVALVRALARHRPLAGGESEFLALHGFVSGLGGDVVSRVHGDPYARLWTRLGFELCGAALRGEDLPREGEVLARDLGSRDPRALLRHHLGQYKRLALGAALLAGAKLEFSEPFETSLPMAIPGAAASLIGSGRAAIRGAVDGELILLRGKARPAACPVARVDGLALPLQPHGWLVPATDWSPPASRTTFAFQASQVPLVESALALIARHQPDVFDQMRVSMRWLAINPVSESDVLNYVSFSELPGTFALQGIPNAYSAAEACLHEFHHGRLFCLEESEPILASDALGTEDDASYYSPWRPEPRPLRGILHGVYVTAAQLRFWLAVARASDSPDEIAGTLHHLLIRQPLAIELGLGQLDRHATFTPAGSRLFARLRADVEAWTAAARTLGVPRDAEAITLTADGRYQPQQTLGGRSLRVRETIVDHVRRHDARAQIPATWLEANAG